MRVVDINALGASQFADEVWLVDPRARCLDPSSFDRLGLDANKRAASIRVCLVAMPGPIQELERRVAAHRAVGAPAVLRLCPGPGGHGFPLEPWAVSPIPEYCEREEMSVAVDFADAPLGYHWAEIVRFAREYPRLPIVALGSPLSGPTPARALDAAPNLILETSAPGASQSDQISALVRSHGAYRFAYGSGTAGSAPEVIASALGAADKQIVFSETADQLGNGTWAATHL